jgi:hypothetical protein
MKKSVFILAAIFFLTGCKKTIQQAAQDAILDAMTNGQWVITNFTTNGTNITSDFSAYKFQYYRNYTVDAIKNGIVEKTGTWQSDVNAMNITGNFPNPNYPLSFINGTWHITNNSWTYVIATMTVGSEVRNLRLDKQ